MLLHSATQFRPFSTLPWDDQYPNDQYPLHHPDIDQNPQEGKNSPQNRPLDLPRFRGELWAWDQGIWSEGILLSCLVGILLFGPRRSHSSIPAGTRVRPSRAAAVK